MGSPITDTDPSPWSKVLRHFGILWGLSAGYLASWVLIDDTDSGDTEAGVIASAAGAVIGILVVTGQFIYRRIKKSKKSSKEKQEPPFLPEDKNNTTHNRVKAGATSGAGFGCLVGAAIGAIFPLPLVEKPLMVLGGAVGGVLGGIIAIILPKWIPPSRIQHPQANPTSERIRSGAMLGSCIGIVFGVLVLGTLTPFGLPLCILFGAGLGTVLFSIVAFLLDEKMVYEDPNVISNPWAKRIRAGVQWGACAGILLGVLLPGLGMGLSTTVSVLVGGALFSIGGTVIALIAEPLITRLIIAVCGEDYQTANAWVPRARCGSFYGTWIGTLIGCCIFPGFVGATLGGAIGGLVGGLVAVVAEPLYITILAAWKGKKYTEIVGTEDLKVCPSGNQWSERCRTGTQVGVALGALIGFFAFPPFGIFFGSAIGGILGGAIAFLIPADWRHQGEPDAEQGYALLPNDSVSTKFSVTTSPLLVSDKKFSENNSDAPSCTSPEPKFK